MSLNGQWIEVFRSGSQTDSAGNTRDWTNDDLDKIVNLYNNQDPKDRQDAPIVKGHPEHDKPAEGWVQKLKRVGDTLLAKLDQVSDEFNELVKTGRFKKRSIALYNNLMLKHIGFLGAAHPAVGGMHDAVFCQGADYMAFEFGEGEFKFEDFKDDSTQEKTNLSLTVEIGNETKQMFNNMESMMKEYFEQLKSWFKSTFSEADSAKILDKMTELDTKFQEPPAPVVTADFKESKEYKDMVAEQEASRAEIAKMRETARRKDWDNFCDGIINTALTPTADKAAKLLPASVDSVKTMANALYGQFTAEFSETTKIEDTPAAKTLSSFLEGLPDQKLFSTQAGKEGREDVVTTSEFANSNCDPAELEFHKKVKSVQKEKNISYAEALDIVTSEEV